MEISVKVPAANPYFVCCYTDTVKVQCFILIFSCAGTLTLNFFHCAVPLGASASDPSFFEQISVPFVPAYTQS